MTYEEAKAHAKRMAALTGYDYGLCRDAFGGIMAFILPPAEQRSGRELRCEVVRYADLPPSEREQEVPHA